MRFWWQILIVYSFQFEAILHSSAFYKTCGEGKTVVDEIWSLAKAPMFSLTEKSKQLGLGTKGVTKYFSSNCDEVYIFNLKSDASDSFAITTLIWKSSSNLS